LNKKQWHTGHIRNIEKVWVAEQKAQKEQDRVKELQKQLTEERSVEAIRKLQKESGLIAQGAGDRLDWMYQMGTVGPSAEEYLLGKEFKNDIAKEEIKQVESKPGSLFLQTNVNQELEAETRLREDPLLALLKEDKLRKENILKNPVKMEEIRKAALLTKLVSATKKRHKREKKKKKKGSNKSDNDSDGGSKKANKDKKHKKMEPEHNESKPSSAAATTPISTTQVKKEPTDASDSSTHRRRKSKSRSKSRDREGRDKRTTNGHGGSNTDKDNHSRSRKSRSRSKSKSRSRGRRGRGDSDRRRSRSPPPHRRSRSRSRSKTRRGKERSRSKSPSRKQDSDKDKDTHATSSKEEADREREAARERMKAVPALSKSSIGQYGLIMKQTEDPERDKERQRERESAENKRKQEREEKEKQRYHRKPAGSHTKQMSAEEKAQKLAEMMADGERHDADATARYVQHQAKEKQEEQAYFQREEHAEKKASFISSMNKDVYSGKESVEDRLKKYSQYRQKGATEDHSFMKRD